MGWAWRWLDSCGGSNSPQTAGCLNQLIGHHFVATKDSDCDANSCKCTAREWKVNQQSSMVCVFICEHWKIIGEKKNGKWWTFTMEEERKRENEWMKRRWSLCIWCWHSRIQMILYWWWPSSCFPSLCDPNWNSSTNSVTTQDHAGPLRSLQNWHPHTILPTNIMILKRDVYKCNWFQFDRPHSRYNSSGLMGWMSPYINFGCFKFNGWIMWMQSEWLYENHFCLDVSNSMRLF